MYYAVVKWYSFAHSDAYNNLMKKSLIEWSDDKIFMQRYVKRLRENLLEIMNMYSIDWDEVVFAIDAPRSDIWRKHLLASYKESRSKESPRGKDMYGVLKFAKQTLIDDLCRQYGSRKCQHDHAEADDIIAIMTKSYQTRGESVVILTSDKDMIQLRDKNVKVVDIQGSEIAEGDANQVALTLLEHVLLGDKSDDIPPIFRGCGKKTAAKLAADPEALKLKLEQDPAAAIQFDLNSRLIDFKMIPEDIVNEVNQQFWSTSTDRESDK